MDLTPLYELRDRLKTSAIAGTELMCEDFRLKRTLEAFTPLEQAAPVFAKIGQLVQAVLAADCPDRPGALLDAVTLMDAVLCTQGKVVVQGDVEEIMTAQQGNVVTNAPYSILAALLDALKHSGGGRYGIVMETHEEHPELFQDYRVKTALVQALGAPYAELADQVAAWLKEDSPAIVPLLKNGFDPKGKKEMVRRVKVIDALAGAQENDFYLSQLELAEKEVKDALIYALRHTEDNARKLLELVKTEKGDLRNAARWALACLNSQAVWDYWTTFMTKKPREAAGFLLLATADTAGVLLADELKKQLTPFMKPEQDVPLEQETGDAIAQLVMALPGKTGAAVCAAYRQAAALEHKLDRPLAGQENDWSVMIATGPYQYHSTVFSQLIPYALQQAILVRPAQDLLDLALELYETYGALYLPAALVAKFLTEDSPSCYQWVASLLEKRTILGTKQSLKHVEQLKSGLSVICWNEKQNGFVLQTRRYSPVDEEYVVYTNEPAAPLDERFYDLLLGLGKKDLDVVLAQWIQPHNKSLCAKLGKYFYQRALLKKDCQEYLDYMRNCGWEDCTGLLLHYCQTTLDISWWAFTQFIERMPGTNETKADEVQRVYDAVERGDIKRGDIVKQTIELNRLKEFIFELRKGEPIS